MDSVSNVVPLHEGAVINWEKDGKIGTATVTKLVPEKELVILTEMDGDKDSHTFSLRPSGGFFGMAADEAKV